eukprot:3205060-Rhodomonas_salina.2
MRSAIVGYYHCTLSRESQRLLPQPRPRVQGLRSRVSGLGFVKVTYHKKGGGIRRCGDKATRRTLEQTNQNRLEGGLQSAKERESAGAGKGAGKRERERASEGESQRERSDARKREGGASTETKSVSRPGRAWKLSSPRRCAGCDWLVPRNQMSVALAGAACSCASTLPAPPATAARPPAGSRRARAERSKRRPSSAACAVCGRASASALPATSFAPAFAGARGSCPHCSRCASASKPGPSANPT